MKKKILTFVFAFMLSLAGVVGGLCLNNTMVASAATITKTYVLETGVCDIEDVGTYTVDGFKVTLDGWTFEGTEICFTYDYLILFYSDIKSNAIGYICGGTNLEGYNGEGWYYGIEVLKKSEIEEVSLMSNVMPCLVTDEGMNAYTWIKCDGSPTVNITLDENSNVVKVLEENAVKVPSTGIKFENNNYVLPMIILGATLVVTGVAAAVVLRKNKKHN